MINSENIAQIKDKKLVIFDLDGTLTPSKSPMDAEMANLLSQLLIKKMVVVVSGGAYHQFIKQFLPKLSAPINRLNNLFLFPTNATRMYRYADGWQEVYAELMPAEERAKIKAALAAAFTATHYSQPSKLYGEIIEDRDTQITFSALGQEAPPEAKAALKARWQIKGDPRIALKAYLDRALPNLEVRLNGMTSIDITRQGLDKAYAIVQIEKHLSLNKKEMIFIGDALFPGGNDYAVRKTGVECLMVADPEETKKLLRLTLTSL